MNILPVLARSGASGLLAAGAVLLQPAWAGHANVLLEAQLDGREQVSDSVGDARIVGDPDGRGRAYVFGIDGDPATLCYVVEVSHIAGLAQPPGSPYMAHIHEAPRGSNGPVVASLAWPQGGQAADCLTEGEGAGTAGVKFPTGEVGLVQRILADPDAFYVNVHNADYPGGALRGQLRHD